QLVAIALRFLHAGRQRCTASAAAIEHAPAPARHRAALRREQRLEIGPARGGERQHAQRLRAHAEGTGTSRLASRASTQRPCSRRNTVSVCPARTLGVPPSRGVTLTRSSLHATA